MSACNIARSSASFVLLPSPSFFSISSFTIQQYALGPGSTDSVLHLVVLPLLLFPDSRDSKSLHLWNAPFVCHRLLCTIYICSFFKTKQSPKQRMCFKDPSCKKWSLRGWKASLRSADLPSPSIPCYDGVRITHEHEAATLCTGTLRKLLW